MTYADLLATTATHGLTIWQNDSLQSNSGLIVGSDDLGVIVSVSAEVHEDLPSEAIGMAIQITADMKSEGHFYGALVMQKPIRSDVPSRFYFIPTSEVTDIPDGVTEFSTFIQGSKFGGYELHGEYSLYIE